MKRFLASWIHGIGRALFPRPNRVPPDPQTTQRIVVANFHYIGDVLFCTPAIAALKARFPAATIEALVKTRGCDVLAGNPAIDRVAVFDPICNDRTREPATDWRAVRALARRLAGVDLWVDFTGVPASCVLARWAKPRWSLGFSRSGLGFVFDQELWPAPDIPFVEKYNSLVSLVGSAADAVPRFYASEEAPTTTAAEVCLHVGGGFPLKLWGRDRFDQLADRLRALGLKVLTLGGPDDTAEVTNLTLRQAVALARRCRVYVGHDTGLTHIVASLGVPTVAIYGPTNPRFSQLHWPNLRLVCQQLECSPGEHERQCAACRPMFCSHHRCMRTLGVEQVLAEIQQCLAASSISSPN